LPSAQNGNILFIAFFYFTSLVVAHSLLIQIFKYYWLWNVTISKSQFL